jgi:hypothetical protein
MIWLNPVALFALAAIAAPILIHLLIQRRAERFPFPTLRFLQPTRLAAIRRHLLEDLPLLAVRALILAAAVAALAGPLFVTSARRQAWDRRVARAIVTDAETVSGLASAQEASLTEAPEARRRVFPATDLADGIRRAILWLDAAPPARREILIASTLAIGSITAADIALIPSDVGVRFERTGTLPPVRAVPAGRVLTPAGARAREITFEGVRTSVRETPIDGPLAWPIEVVTAKADQPAADAARAAVLSQRVWAGPSDRRVRLFIGGPLSAVSTAAEIVVPWMADAVARIARDRDFRDAGARVATGLADPRFAAAPWQPLAVAADGRAIAVAAASAGRLVVTSAAAATDLATPLLMRAIANAIAPAVDLQRAEVVPIADAELQRWSRPSAPVTAPRIDTVEQDDRRWLWLAALGLLALETWMRRARAADVTRDAGEEHARVA